MVRQSCNRPGQAAHLAAATDAHTRVRFASVLRTLAETAVKLWIRRAAFVNVFVRLQSDNAKTKLSVSLRDTRGQALLFVLILLSAGTLIMSGFLTLTGTLLLTRGQDQEDLLSRYASESGINDVLADLLQGEDALSPGYAVPSPSVNEYPVSVSISAPSSGTQPAGTYQYVNPGAEYGLASLASGQAYYLTLDNVAPSTQLRLNWAFTPESQWWRVRVYADDGPPGAPDPTLIASEDWESGGWGGGTGWLGPWYERGPSTVETTGNPYGGSYHLEMKPTAYVSRSADLSGRTNARLRFWTKASSFEKGETVTLAVSPDGSNWTVVRSWQANEADNVYRYEDIDLASFSMSSAFYIAFEAHMSGAGDYFWVDDIQLVSQVMPAVIEESEGITGPAELLMDITSGGQYTVVIENRSGTTLVSQPYSSTGGSNNTWVYAQSFKDYLISSSAGDGTAMAYVRQVPGPSTPTIPQQVYIESWKEP